MPTLTPRGWLVAAYALVLAMLGAWWLLSAAAAWITGSP